MMYGIGKLCVCGILAYDIYMFKNEENQRKKFLNDILILLSIRIDRD